MRFLILVATSALPFALCAQGTFCSPQGNVALFSNYDGGALTIRVDQDIPDLHIGVVSYEYATITVTGPYAGNVVAVHYAGYNGTNDHCDQGSLVFSTTISGVPSSAAEIELYPAATYPNTNGWPNIICAYSCDIGTEQGGCNTVDQVAHYFLDMWNGVLLFHRTQYGCWNGTWNISDGGNCCVDPLETGFAPSDASIANALRWDRVGDVLNVHTDQALVLVDAAGRTVRSLAAAPGGVQRFATNGLPMGTYVVREQEGARYARFIVAR